MASVKKRYIGILIIILLAITFIVSIKLKVDEKYKEIVRIIENFETNKISNDELEDYINFMDKINKNLEKDLLIAFTKINDNELDLAESILSKNISKFKKDDNVKIRLLYGEHLANLYIANNNREEAINLIQNYKVGLNYRDYKYNIDNIFKFIDNVIESLDVSLAIEILEEIEEKNLNLPDEVYLKVLNKLRQLYLLTYNYARASDVSVRAIYLSDKLNYKYEKAQTMIELGVLFKRIKGEETAIKIIKESLNIEIQDAFKNADVKVYALINLCELYLDKENYEEAEKFSERIPLYKNNFSEEDYRDIEILKNNVDAQIYIYQNDLNKAKDYLDKSLELQSIDKEQYYYGKDIPYNLVKGKLLEAEKKYDEAKSLYKEILIKAASEENYYLYEKVLRRLINLEEDINEKNKYLNELVLLTDYEQDKRYGDYTENLWYRIEYERQISEKHDFEILIYEILLAGVFLIIIFKKKIIKIKKRYTHDVLTDCYNRRVFDKFYKRLLIKKSKYSLIIMDIDNFKKINDSYGHQFGDKVLIEICKLIQSKIPKNYKLFRYGGEEFVIVAPKETFEEVLETVEHIRKSIESMPWQYDIKVTVSMGMSSTDCGENILENADKNLYISKNTGKNKITYN